jgi:pyruvate dehydrogenase E2 component (dihydrolipoamide acetyltransferase)
MEEGTLTRWLKHEGDAVNVDDVLAEVETDKATMEWHSFDAGTLLKILVTEGTVLAPDDPVAIIGKAGESIDELLKSTGGAPASSADPKKDEAPAQAAKESKTEADRRSDVPDAKRGEDAQSSDEPSSRDPERAQETPSDPTRRAASPSVRRLARERGIALDGIEGTGPAGRIIQRDLDKALESGAHGANGAQPQTTDVPTEHRRPSPKTVPLAGTRRTIARRLTEAKQTIPHYYLSLDVDAQQLRQGLRELNSDAKEGEPKISVNDVILRACAQTLRLVPEVNVSLKSETILFHQVVDIAVAIAVEDGLTVPVIRDVDTKGLRAIGREVRHLATLAREKRLSPEHLAGGTFCVSNLGMYGIHSFAAIINPPQAAILAVGTIREEPVLTQGKVRAGAKMQLTLSCDHRLIDGAVGARWLRTLGDLIESPLRMLL